MGGRYGGLREACVRLSQGFKIGKLHVWSLWALPVASLESNYCHGILSQSSCFEIVGRSWALEGTLQSKYLK